MMKKGICFLLSLCLMLCCASAEAQETVIVLGETITVNGSAIGEDPSAAVYLERRTETHSDVAPELQNVENRVITVTDGGTYRFSGEGMDVQIAVRVSETEDVRLILDWVNLTCRTSAAIVVYSARDPRTAGEYGVVMELAQGSDNHVTGSHTVAMEDGDTKLDGAVCSLVSLGIEGEGNLSVEADNEGIEVKFGHMTINGGNLEICSGDDPLNVSEDGVGVLTMNDGYVFSTVRNEPGGEGDGIDSNGWIIFNGGTAINLAHPASQDGGIDSDMGSFVNGGVIVGAGNMYDPIESDSEQLFMMLEFAESTDDLLVVTDEAGEPVFAYDFPYDYQYIAFSTPDLKEGETYHVYLGGQIEGEEKNGLYSTVVSYQKGRQMMHGEGNADQRMPGALDPMQGAGAPVDGGRPGNAPGMQQPWKEAEDVLASIDLNEILKDADFNEVLKDVDLNELLTGVSIADLLSEEQLKQYLGDVDPETVDWAARNKRDRNGFGGGFGMHGMASSADAATTDFLLTKETTGFTNVQAMEK